MLNTGNDFADSMLERRLSQSPEYWALVDYLESKGVLDHDEFLQFLSSACKRFVEDVNDARMSLDD